MASQDSESQPVIVWFRQDLRTQDNPALQAAIESGHPLVAVYILDDAGEGEWAPGGASRWWLHHALKDLSHRLKEAGGKLLLLSGDSGKVLNDLIREIKAGAVFWNRRYEPQAIERDSQIKEDLQERDLEVTSFNATLLHEPHRVSTKSGGPYKVFTPYWRYCHRLNKTEPVKVTLSKARFRKSLPKGDKLADWGLLPDIAWDAEFYDGWDPTIKGAETLLKDCLRNKLADYSDERNTLGADGTSRLSPYLHFGQISPNQIWQAIRAHRDAGNAGSSTYTSEIGWREFSYYLLYHFPHTPTEPLRSEFEEFPWDADDRLLDAWKQGQTGFPVVDAGMRQLWKTGWMHNRARMITASFLVKHLLQPWQEGARWFWDTLVDADLASNTQGWQWTAGCGADASPYFRVFNPIIQGEKFDRDGRYVRRWVPELAELPDKYIHQPWEAAEDVLENAGVRLGDNYPEPVVSHKEGRERALKAYELFKASNRSSK